ncbi:helix-turn-helix transcriptional regulator [Rhodanobacter sp. 7MK24]|uniref:helix-turn-helix transcriptional regulator n=1 Tax=Rhodanobacter sp. 7MK24 TaxID=2775922 RepID=UPI0017812BFF|nr:helix-turn-helix transcriptional regulator [Rhodanobacter sp. 7MK24]MBD8879810.1 helix-turn-helix transcriptional regulator [Rhodanobacter sp. 7MK24]
MDEAALKNSLRVYRAAKELTQADLAELIGVTRKSINAIEQGRMVPSTILALRLAHALGTTVEDIFSLDDFDLSAITKRLSMPRI